MNRDSTVQDQWPGLGLVVLLCLVLVGCGQATMPVASAEPSAAPTATIVAQITETAGSPARHYEPQGGFSYVPPAGWQVTESASRQPYKVVVGPEEDGFSPNITVVDEEFSGTLDEYVAASLENMQSFFDGFQLIGRDLFKPAEGSEGAALVIENVQSGQTLRQIFFIFDAGSKKVVVACTRRAGGGKELDAACEQMARTFRFESE